MQTRGVFRPRPPPAVPDAVEKQVQISLRAVLRAAWAVADVPDPHEASEERPGTHPKMACLEAIQALDYALKSAFCGDGGDAVIGHAMVARSLAAKAQRLRDLGRGWGHPPEPEVVLLAEEE